MAYQEIDGKKREVEVAYQVAGKRYGFLVGEYEGNETLVIDPLLASTFYSGNR